MDKRDLISNIIKVSYKSKEGHIGSSLSILDFLISLYDGILSPQDEFILSKGHASLALYAIMLEKKAISEEEFFSFCGFDSKLGGHPSSRKLDQVKVSTGSLGHGLPFAVGLALAKKIKKESGTIYCLIGDGEANEGTIWESALLAGSLELKNLVCAMDFNGSGERAVRLRSCVEKFKSFYWDSCCVDGHNQQTIHEALKRESALPRFIELRTVKGSGCGIMENNPEWHHKYPNSEAELEAVLKTIY